MMDSSVWTLNYTRYADYSSSSFRLSGNLGNTTDDLQDVEKVVPLFVLPPELGARTTIVVAYLLTLIFGSLGNGLVIDVICRHPEIRTKSVANYYILNLAVADFIFVAMLVFFCYATFTGHWVFGGVICKLACVVRESSKYVSVFTLVALSFDRFLASFYNAGRYRTVLVGKLVCGAIWVGFIALSIPYWIHCHVVSSVRGRNSCRIILPSNGTSVFIMKTWYSVQFVLGFLIPFLLILAAYSALGVRLHRLLNAGTKTGVKRPGRAMTRMTLVITVTFLVTQLPYYVSRFMNVAKMEAVHSQDIVLPAGTAFANETSVSPVRSPIPHDDARRYVILNSVTTILVFICSCCNPIIYGLLNRNYRNLYADKFCGRCRRHSAADATSGSSDSGVANGEARNRARHSGVSSVTGVTNIEVVELSKMI